MKTLGKFTQSIFFHTLPFFPLQSIIQLFHRYSMCLCSENSSALYKLEYSVGVENSQKGNAFRNKETLVHVLHY